MDVNKFLRKKNNDFNEFGEKDLDCIIDEHDKEVDKIEIF